jgi:hypothetical protein
MDSGDALLFEREFQTEIEIRRIDANKNIRRIRPEISPQLAAYTEDFEIVAQHFDVAAHRQFFHRE